MLLPPDLREWLDEDHLAWFVIEAIEELYSQRQWMVEPVFARSRQTGGSSASTKRPGGRSSEWRLIAATHNLLKLYRHSLAAATA